MQACNFGAQNISECSPLQKLVLRFEMDLALEKALNKELSIRKASTIYNVPYTTLYRAVERARSKKGISRGRPVAFNEEEEQLLVKIITEFGELGKPLARADLLEITSLMISSLPASRKEVLTKRFKGGKPCRELAACFLKR